jgi:hypothetical protein
MSLKKAPMSPASSASQKSCCPAIELNAVAGGSGNGRL